MAARSEVDDEVEVADVGWNGGSERRNLSILEPGKDRVLDAHGAVRKRCIASEGDLVALGMSAVEGRAWPAHPNPMPQSRIRR